MKKYLILILFSLLALSSANFFNDPDAEFTITNLQAGLSLQIYQCSQYNYAPIVQWSKAEGMNQRFKLIEVQTNDDQFFLIQSVSSKKYLEIQSTSNSILLQNELTLSQAQRFYISQIGRDYQVATIRTEKIDQNLPNNDYLSSDSYQIGSTIRVKRVPNSEVNSYNNLKWVFRKNFAPDIVSKFRIKSVSWGNYFDVSTSNNQVVANTDNNQASQQWRFMLKDENIFYIQNTQNSKYLKIENGSSSSGAKLVYSDIQTYDESMQFKVTQVRFPKFYEIMAVHSNVRLSVGGSGSNIPVLQNNQYSYMYLERVD